ncbi:kinase-like domain-containing protein [Mycena alexandri]|uniref:Kinase-like domain-containing protein n=1 Tax=Mycena alexandri TaxID=1745969 RepID=A0AAD6T715_9AGAR|nr:kinase-like domain-containing protein [Mycena alexandri]
MNAVPSGLDPPLKIIDRIVNEVYLSCLPQLNIPTPECNKHFCSTTSPCRRALILLAPLLSVRLVASSWNTAFKNFQHSTRGAFFSTVEDGVYYPHAWHINTRVRKAVLLTRYRVFRTIHSEAGNRGVYLAYDFGGAKGCAEALEVIIKGWVTASDFECQREIAAYSVLSRAKPCRGVPLPWTASAQHDPVCDVHALVLPKLGPTLEDLRELLPDKRFDALMVLTVGIQMIERYQDIHARGLIHNGIKPANICLSPRGSADPPDMLYAIDFGFSTTPDMASESPLPSGHRIDAIGNRRFMSVFAHHGISQSQRDDLESLAYLLSYLFHSSLPWDTPKQHQPHVWRIKMATPPSILFRHMDACFLEFWRDVKALAYAEVPDYDRMRARFVACLEEHETSGVPVEWWDIWGKWK